MPGPSSETDRRRRRNRRRARQAERAVRQASSSTAAAAQSIAQATGGAPKPKRSRRSKAVGSGLAAGVDQKKITRQATKATVKARRADRRQFHADVAAGAYESTAKASTKSLDSTPQYTPPPLEDLILTRDASGRLDAVEAKDYGRQIGTRSAGLDFAESLAKGVITAGEIATLVTPAGAGRAVLKEGAELALKEGAKVAAKKAAQESTEAAARASAKSASASVTKRAGETIARGARGAKRAARKVDDATSVRGLARRPRRAPVAKAAAPARATTRAGRVGRAAGATAKVAGRTAAFPIRHPLKVGKYSFAAQAPAALTAGDPGEFKKVLGGDGVAANVLSGVGSAAADLAPGEIAGNLVKDLFDLPAQTVPAIYMPLAGLVEAAKGDSSRLEALWQDYTASGLLPAVVKRDPAAIKRAIVEHPLFAALEARGVQGAAGRSAGAVARAAPVERIRQVGSQQRKPLRIAGELAPKPRTYSPDLIEKGAQVIADRRRGAKRGGQKASPRERERILRERVDRAVAAEEGARRAGRSRAAETAVDSLKTGSRIPGRRKISNTDKLGVSLAVQGIIPLASDLR